MTQAEVLAEACRILAEHVRPEQALLIERDGTTVVVVERATFEGLRDELRAGSTPPPEP